MTVENGSGILQIDYPSCLRHAVFLVPRLWTASVASRSHNQSAQIVKGIYCNMDKHIVLVNENNF